MKPVLDDALRQFSGGYTPCTKLYREIYERLKAAQKRHDWAAVATCDGQLWALRDEGHLGDYVPPSLTGAKNDFTRSQRKGRCR